MDDALKALVLRRGPVGRWRTAEGSAGALVGERYEFDASGNGRIHTHSPAFGAETLGFVWQMAAPGVLQVRRADPGDDEADLWITVAMEFRSLATDSGGSDVLAEREREGFWLAHAPLAWDGP
jgi:hypothetical protein